MEQQEKDKFYNSIIKSYQKIIKNYKMMMILVNIFWFWTGYFYGMNNFIITALIVQIIITIIWILGE